MNDFLRHTSNLDSTALEHLMDQYGQDVWNFAFFIVRNHSAADDIAQEVFLQAFHHAHTYRGEASIKTWLLKITRNRSYNYRKSTFLKKVLLVDTVRLNERSRSAEQEFLDQEATNDVWKQVFALPTKLRVVLILHAKYQLPMSEIAAVLGIPEGTVKSRLHNARKKLSMQLKGKYWDGEHESYLV